MLFYQRYPNKSNMPYGIFWKISNKYKIDKKVLQSKYSMDSALNTSIFVAFKNGEF